MSGVAPGSAYIGLGANLGDARHTLQAALARLSEFGPLRASSFYGSAPIDAGGPDFVNAVARLECRLTPEQLLAELQRIEASFGRERPFRHAPRTLDLDLLLHGQAQRSGVVLTLPHPRMHRRAFVLRPLLELAPDLVVPGLGRLADHLPAVAQQHLWRLEP